MDVKGAYLYGVLEERIYVQQPEGFEDGTGRVCLLLRSIHGLERGVRRRN